MNKVRGVLVDKTITIHYIELPQSSTFLSLLDEADGYINWFADLILDKHFGKIAFYNGINTKTKRKKIKYSLHLAAMSV